MAIAAVPAGADGPAIVLASAGSVEVTAVKSNPGENFTDSISVSTPSPVTPVCSPCTGSTASVGLGQLAAGTTIVVALYVANTGTTYYSTGAPSEPGPGATVTQMSPTSWSIAFEDLGQPPDPDFTVSVTETTGGAPSQAVGTATGDAARHDPTCNGGDPVNCASGDFWQTFTDVSVPGLGAGLDLTRTYNSDEASTASVFGYGWSSSYSENLVANPDGSVIITEDDGSQLTALPNGSGGYVVPSFADSTLAHTAGGGWAFVRQGALTYDFSPPGQLTSITDRNGYATNLTYNPAGQLTSATDPSGRTITFAYGANGSVSTATAPMDEVTTYGYDSSGDLTSVTNPAGGVTSSTYNGAHQLVTMIDPYGGITTNVYNSSGQVASQTDPSGRVTTFAYAGANFSAAGGSTTITDPNGDVEVEHYTSGELVSITKAYGTASAATTTYAYDPATLGLTSVSDPDGHITTNTFDASGNLASTTDAMGNVTSATYNSHNEPLTATNTAGVTTTDSYDGLGNLTSTSTPLVGSATVATTTDTYANPTEPGELTSSTNPDGKITTYSYDPYGDVVSVTDPMGNETTYTYNSLGERSTAVAPKGNVAGANPATYTTTYSYDPLGNLTRQVNPEGATTTYAYDADSNVTTSTDPTGKVTTDVYNTDNELTATHQPSGTTLAYTYDPDGNLASEANGAGQTTTYAYNALGEATSATDPLGHVTSFGYDPAGNQTSLTNPAGQTTTTAYNPDNEVTSTAYSDGTTPSVTYSYNTLGERTAMHDGAGTSTYAYDSLGRLTSTTDGAGASVAYTYNLDGDATSIAYPGSTKVVTRTYNADDALASVSDWLGHTTTYTYDPDNQVNTQSDPNGTTQASTYDATGNVASITDTASGSSEASFTYTHNSDSQVISEVDAGMPNPPQTYTYDSASQLASSTNGSYSYDSAKDLTQAPGQATQTYNADDELTGSEAIALVGTASAADVLGLSTTTTIALPAGTVAGDQILVSNVSTTGAGPSVAGYVSLASANSGSGTTTTVLRRTATATDTSVTLHFPFLDPRAVTVSVYSGVSTTNPIDAISTGATAAGATVTTPSLTASVAGEELVQLQGANSLVASRWSPPTGLTETAQTTAGLLFDSGVADKALSTTGQTGADTARYPALLGAGLSAVALTLRPGTAYAYNANGDRTETTTAPGASVALAYDQANQLTTYGGATTYAYDGDGLRTSKTTSGTTQVFSYDQVTGSTPLLISDGSTDYIYGAGDLPIEQISSTGTVYYYEHDGLGSTRALTNSAGAVVATFTYSPYGQLVSHTGTVATPLGFTGAYTDAESGFIYLLNRYYDPTTEAFVTVDPAVALTQTPYAYVGDDPLDGTDPSGRSATSLIDPMASYIPGGSVSTPNVYGLCFGSLSPLLTPIGGVAQAGVGIEALNPAQLSNYNRYVTKLPSKAGTPNIAQLEDGSVEFSSEVPGNVPGSYAEYTKTVNAAGNTTGYIKTTVAPDGSVISVKDKFNLVQNAGDAAEEGEGFAAEAEGTLESLDQDIAGLL